MGKEKADMIIYTTEDGLTKVETTFDGDIMQRAQIMIRKRKYPLHFSKKCKIKFTTQFMDKLRQK